MKKQSIGMILVLFLMGVAACQSGSGGATAPKSTPELQQLLGAGKKTVVFFLNPTGGPCRAQDEILQKLYSDRGGNFNVAYVSAVRQDHQQAFYDYGVRSLPSLVLVDSSGRIAQHFSPGIQPYETIAKALDGAK